MLRRPIKRVLAQVHPGMQISREAVDAVEALLRASVDSIDEDPEGFLGPVLYAAFMKDYGNKVHKRSRSME